MTDITKERLLEKAWRFDIQYGPDGEANYAWVYNGKDLVATMRTHYADSIVEAMNRRAPLSALPGEAEVVAWAYPQGEKLGVTTNRQTACDAFPGIAKPIPLVTLASLQAMQARAEKAERERDHWKANHAEMVQRNAVLRERPDLPADRLPSIARYEARVKDLEAENARLRRLDAEYGRVETAIIMADPDFDGDSPHDNCGDRLIASVHRLRDLAALTGGSNG